MTTKRARCAVKPDDKRTPQQIRAAKASARRAVLCTMENASNWSYTSDRIEQRERERLWALARRTVKAVKP